MKISDVVYGDFEVNEKVLIDLINCRAVQRLKGISQQGIPVKYGKQPPFSRYEHSLGVMLLLRKLGAGLEEQIAGLLHDISHTTFSHLIDWVIGDPKKQDFQDKRFGDVLKRSDIPEILSRQGFNVGEFLDLEKFSILEQEAPGLCVDRIDYCLRDLIAHGGKIISDEIVRHLIVFYDRVVFDSSLAAYFFCNEYAALQRHNWGSDENTAGFQIFADILKNAMKKKIIEEKDFYGVDSEVIEKLEASGDKDILDSLGFLREGFWLDYNVIEGIVFKSKFRYIDPDILLDNSLKRFSEVFPLYKGLLDLQKRHFEEDRFGRIIPR